MLVASCVGIAISGEVCISGSQVPGKVISVVLQTPLHFSVIEPSKGCLLELETRVKEINESLRTRIRSGCSWPEISQVVSNHFVKVNTVSSCHAVHGNTTCNL